MYYALLYDYVADVVTRRQPHRQQHLELLRGLHERGELVMAGAWADPVDGAALIFKVDDSSVIERFVESDPYVANGLVSRWRIRKWDIVIGGEADS